MNNTTLLGLASGLMLVFPSCSANNSTGTTTDSSHAPVETQKANTD
jgi:hypothetical protein